MEHRPRPHLHRLRQAGVDRLPSPSGGTISAYPYEVWHYKYIAGIGDNVDLAFVDTCQCGDYHYTIDPSEKEARAALPGPGLAKQESAQLDANDAQISLAKKLLAPPSISEEKQDAAQQTTAAQGTGSISGTIVDPHGALVPRAKVTAINTDTALQGDASKPTAPVAYSIPPLPAGPIQRRALAPRLPADAAARNPGQVRTNGWPESQTDRRRRNQSLTVAAKPSAHRLRRRRRLPAPKSPPGRSGFLPA